ncbi:MAG: hypothetical protein LBC67_00110 [Spirochaetales bacterium]|jgi:hypothetical protein|nr:hypothetical protein [Spirochaetales bacterium]
MEKLLTDKNSPPTFGWSNDIDENEANGNDGIIFTTVIPEDLADYPPNAIYQAETSFAGREGNGAGEKNAPKGALYAKRTPVL